MKFFGIFLAFLLSAVGLLGETPEQVVEKYFAKVKTEGFAAIADLIHPAEVSKFKGMMAPVVADVLKSPEAESFGAFASHSDPTLMAEMSDAHFLNLFMTWASNAMPGLRQMMADATVKPLGHVAEGDLRHVVVRLKAQKGEIEIEKLSVMSVKESEGQWMMTLSMEMMGVAEALRKHHGGNQR